jgi:DNA-binding CsgD family transcriptional regulator
MSPGRQAQAELVGREPELALLEEFLELPTGDRTAIVTGTPGIGKTTLWQGAVAHAHGGGAHVLVARASEAERRYSLGTLADLLAEIDHARVECLPAPQRRALEVALLRADPDVDALDPRAVGTGLLSILEALVETRSLVIAIDDVQWVDRESAAALEFARRRLRDRDVTLLFSQRSGTSSALTRRSVDALSIELGPLSFGAIRRILVTRLDADMGRRALRRIHDAADGNPLFALELARALTESGLTDGNDDLPVPDDVEAVLGIRVGRLPHAQRAALLTVALGGDLAPEQLVAITEPGTLGDAERAGVLAIVGGRVRPAHPLYAEAARSHASEHERVAVHIALSEVFTDDELRLRHRALATLAPDDELAQSLAGASTSAARRGAAVTAADLAVQALRLTPAESPARAERLLTLCERLMVSGEPDRATRLLADEITGLPPGPVRARAHLIVADGRGSPLGFDLFRQHLELALSESHDDPVLYAKVVGRRSRFLAAGVLEQLPEAEASALAALPAAHEAGADAEREVLHGLAWARVLRGQAVDDLRDRFNAISDDTFEIYRSLDRVVGERYAHRGEVAAARAILDRLAPLAEERGEEWSSACLRMALCELSLRAGDWNAAAGFLEDWDPAFEAGLTLDPVRDRYRALLAAGQGDADAAELYADAALALSPARESRWHLFEVSRAQGAAALVAGRPNDAIALLRPVWEHLREEGVDDPGVFPIAPDLVEALVAVGEIVEAAAVTDALDAQANMLEHPWAEAAALRCRGTVEFASGADEAAAAKKLCLAAVEFERLGLRYDQARTLLALGRGERRRRRWAAARQALEDAAAAFDAQGSPGWAAATRAELERLGGRRPSANDELTPSERRVAELAAQGLSNKEIASTLVVSVHTVEVHLSRAYAKLDVRSRSQLARVLCL